MWWGADRLGSDTHRGTVLAIVGHNLTWKRGGGSEVGALEVWILVKVNVGCMKEYVLLSVLLGIYLLRYIHMEISQQAYMRTL